MSKITKIFLILSIITPFLIFINLDVPNFHIIPLNSSCPKITVLDSGTQNYTGSYEGDISIMYMWEEWNNSIWSNANSSTNLIPPNQTNFKGYLYNLNRITIEADIKASLINII